MTVALHHLQRLSDIGRHPPSIDAVELSRLIRIDLEHRSIL